MKLMFNNIKHHNYHSGSYGPALSKKGRERAIRNPGNNLNTGSRVSYSLARDGTRGDFWYDSKKPLNIILLGDPAAGKATQAKFLVQKFGLYDLDMGKELRRIKNSESRIKSGIQRIDLGKLAKTKIVREILHKKIATTSKNKGILFDGTPKMLGEAKLVARWLKEASRQDPVVLYLSIPTKETVKRMRSRKEYFNGKYSKRPDDTLKALQNRVQYYRINIVQVVNFFKTRYKFKKINGLGSIKEVQSRIWLALEKLSE